jgi:hypothetical protein
MCSFRCYWRRRGSRLRGGRFEITTCTPRAVSISYCYWQQRARSFSVCAVGLHLSQTRREY